MSCCPKNDRSIGMTFLIPESGDGSAVDALSFGNRYKYFRIICEDKSTIPGGTTLAASVSPDVALPLSILHFKDDPGTKWEVLFGGSASMDVLLTHASGSLLLQLILDTPVTGDTAFVVYGYESID